MPGRRPFFLAGLFLTTFCTLVIEILATRLLSVTTWYHLSFFAVSIALFGMAAGAVRVYVGESEFAESAAPQALVRYARLFALSIPLTHLVSLCIPIPVGTGLPTVLATVVTTVVLAVPFYLSGVTVAIALTRIPGPSGLIYAVDLLGAALGSIGVVALFEFSSIVSAMLTVGAVALLGAGCFSLFAGASARHTGARTLPALGLLLLLAFGNETLAHPLSTLYAKGNYQNPRAIEYEYWTIHGQVAVGYAAADAPFYWARSKVTPAGLVHHRGLYIDGAAATFMTRWDLSPESLGWVQYDVTALPYHLRKGGHNAVIGVGGGRDVLTALWARSESVTGIEINEAFIDLHRDALRGYSQIANDRRVELVHDEARSYLTRTSKRFDVLQMSLIDTWAATGAGAFTLSENGLYTVEAWTTFLGTLAPGGVFSVSRWYARDHASETSRMVSLATAALLELGVEKPQEHIILAASGDVATLVLSTAPFTRRDLHNLRRTTRKLEFDVLLAPGYEATDPALRRIAASGSRPDLLRATADPRYDYSPPSDERPYFFNILKPGRFMLEEARRASMGVVAEGNLLATLTLGLLWLVTFGLVLTTILGPLARSGLPSMPLPSFALAIAYFALIGAGFMFVQVPLMQRFSVYLGHPTYSLAVILFSMILAAGAGSWLSDRLPIEASPLWVALIAPAIALELQLWSLALQPIIEGTIELGLAARVAITAGVVATMALPLGFCFPIGLRLVQRISQDAMPWMWGINGATGVLASVSAVAVSMWSGITTSLYLAIASYALLTLPAIVLWHRGRDVQG